ncbi:BRCA1 C Terminus (BRCT) domain-containing protein [Besnoitia besnoiti]|uniref:Pescadillo homolog n=1 Tax=Besnoitia besnoiti TaxID=94643 RepID=A0A2A9MCF2_BESBE|nr:BRCA1 C Terminus (BRCT) domain-containing protein [Besnoitia besnoiti]PFH33062.1 BRCA1 C Terminus (BRCT) domain-containing protein [Besnoitia besnoiti]
MGKKIKAGTRGEAAQYMTRGQALKKLQLPLSSFRRLCILKGIYPRDPRKKKKGNDKIYYHTKDVLHIAHEPLLETFRQLKATNKKVRRALGRKEMQLAKRYARSKPAVRLHHIVRERFPTLSDAVADLDDALSTICIFAMLPADSRRGVKAEYCIKAGQLLDEFLLVATQQRALRRVFASIKGYYFQVQFLGHAVTFLMPHQFKQEMPEEVDFRVLSTFFELYSATLHLVIFKLFLLAGLAYPPTATKREAVRRKHRIGKDEAAAIKALAAGRLPPQQRGLHGDGPWGMAGWRYPILQARRTRDVQGTAGESAPVEGQTKKTATDQVHKHAGKATRGESANPREDGEEAERSGATDEQEGEEEEESDEGAGPSSEADAESEGDEDPEEEDDDDVGETAQPSEEGDRAEDSDETEDADADEKPSAAKHTAEGLQQSEGAASVCGVQPHAVQQLFKGCVIFLSREVPLLPFAFMVRSCGGELGWQGPGSPFLEDDSSITHHVVDRPLECMRRMENSQRDYVQPQWVMDSINTGIQLPIHLYAPGKPLPPHLSPFVDDRKEGYVPKQRDVLDRLVAERKGVAAAGLQSEFTSGLDAADSGDASDDDEAIKQERTFQSEVEGEAQANSPDEDGSVAASNTSGSAKRPRSSDVTARDEDSSAPSALKLSGKARQELEEREAKKALLSKKHKRLLERIEFGERRKQEATAKLQAKRAALERRGS